MIFNARLAIVASECVLSYEVRPHKSRRIEFRDDATTGQR